jgi:dolichyl-phosphate beta-glucosyltransferase
MTDAPPELSIIIPAYNEEKRIGRTLRDIHEYFATQAIQPGELEIVVVDDGSSDSTPQVVQEYIGEIPGLRLISNQQNRGKGYSVRRGMLEARGAVSLFTDADLSSPIEESEKLLTSIRAGNDFAIGSRAVDRSLILAHQSRFREIAGIVFNGFVRLFTGLQFHDTQCGFKAFASELCRIMFEQQRIDGFGFDPEILFIARKNGLKGAEVPVRWSHDSGTKVHVLRDSFLMFADLVYIRLNWILGRYPAK